MEFTNEIKAKYICLFLAILYELLLDNVFAEADRREVKKSVDSSFVEESPTSGWTEVKNKQSKGLLE